MSRRDSDFERLAQRMHEAERRADEERRRADEERRGRRQAERRADEAERRTRKSTLTEYLELCHTHLFETISLQPEKSLSTQGDITSPVSKTRPDYLQPWLEFLEVQKDILERLQTAYPYEDAPKVFEDRAFMEGLGDRVRSRLLASEEDLKMVQRETVETPVSNIINHLILMDCVRAQFDLPDGIVFDNHPNAISDNNQEVIQRRLPSTPQRSTPAGSRQYSDQICVYTVVEGGRTHRRLAFVIEHKPPHKLTLANLRLGLRSMNLKEDVIDRASVPTSKDNVAHFQYHSDRLVATVVTQAFSYMISGGTQYGYITTGEAFVFLQISPENPGTVYYHLAEPRADVDAQIQQFPANREFHHRTAVSQVLAFTLLALQTARTPQRWHRAALNALGKWEVDYGEVLRSIPTTIRKSPPASNYRPRTYRLVDRSPIQFRRRRAGPVSCNTTDYHGPGDGHDSPDSSDHEHQEAGPLDTLSRPSGRANRRGGSQARGGSQSGSHRQTGSSRQFCTQRCLRGLESGGLLDVDCPNANLHDQEGGPTIYRHRIDRRTLLALLRKQLHETMDEDCQPLGLQGARGALFKVTLASHGYTIVAKGTVQAFVEDLQHEADVYRRLQPLQGRCVPVCLGGVDLLIPYYYDVGVEIMHMMFLSWAGGCLDNITVSEDTERQGLVKKAMRSIKAIHRFGVLHKDVRSANLLWSRETSQIMLIDFERSEIQEGPPTPLSPINLNVQRKQNLEGRGGSEQKGRATGTSLIAEGQIGQDEVYQAQSIMLRLLSQQIDGK